MFFFFNLHGGKAVLIFPRNIRHAKMKTRKISELGFFYKGLSSNETGIHGGKVIHGE